MQNIIRLANDFMLKNGVDEIPLRLEKLSELCGKIGFELFSYKQAAALISNLKLENHTDKAAFTLISDEVKIILFKDEISVSNKLFAIAHEIGHIALKHTYFGILEQSEADTVQEREADTFAYQLLAPLCVLKAKKCNCANDIQRETLLDSLRAAKVYVNMQNYQSSSLDAELLTQFSTAEKNKKAWLINIILSLAAIIILFAVCSHSPTINEVYPTVQTNVSVTQISTTITDTEERTIVLNKNTKTYHLDENCHAAKRIKESNRDIVNDTIDNIKNKGYKPCGICAD